MARARHGRLTDKFIEQLAPLPDGRERVVRDGMLAGFLIRVGKRKRSFEIRIEKSPRVCKHLGEYPTLRADAAREKAQEIWNRHRRGEPIDGPTRDAMSIDAAWPLYRERLEQRGRAPRTVEGYVYALARMSDSVRSQPIRDLGMDPAIMLRETDRIRRDHGPTAAIATARFVRAVYRHAQRRDPTLLGNPVAAVEMTEERRDDLPVMSARELSEWWAQVQALPNPIRREAQLFGLLSGLRRNDLISLRWENLDVKRRALRIPRPKGGPKKAFDLVLSRAMLRCLWRARHAGRMLCPEQAVEFVFASRDSKTGHIQGMTKDKVCVSGHGLRRTLATLATHAGVDQNVVARLLNQAGSGITPHYIRTNALGAYLGASQESASAFLVAALGSPRGLT